MRYQTWALLIAATTSILVGAMLVFRPPRGPVAAVLTERGEVLPEEGISISAWIFDEAATERPIAVVAHVTKEEDSDSTAPDSPRPEWLALDWRGESRGWQIEIEGERIRSSNSDVLVVFAEGEDRPTLVRVPLEEFTKDGNYFMPSNLESVLQLADKYAPQVI